MANNGTDNTLNHQGLPGLAGVLPMAQQLFPGGIPGLAQGLRPGFNPAGGLPLFQAQAPPPRKAPVDRGKAGSSAPRKQCNCKNSRCLKLYCECFASGRYCEACNCLQCYNNRENEATRQSAVEAILERNPNAFRPKITGSAAVISTMPGGRHLKGCNCKKSVCLKKYCECFQANIYCSDMCKCVDCKNYEGSEARTAVLMAQDPTGALAANQPVGYGGGPGGGGGGPKRVRYSNSSGSGPGGMPQQPPQLQMPPAPAGLAAAAAGRPGGILPGLFTAGNLATLAAALQPGGAGLAGLATLAGIPPSLSAALLAAPLLAPQGAAAAAGAGAGPLPQGPLTLLPAAGGSGSVGAVPPRPGSAPGTDGPSHLLSAAMPAMPPPPPAGAGLPTAPPVVGAVGGGGIALPPNLGQAVAAAAAASAPGAGAGPAAPPALPAQGVQVLPPVLGSSIHEVVNGMVKRSVIEELCRLLWLIADEADDSSKGGTGQAAKAVAAAGETGQAAANGGSPAPQGEGVGQATAAVAACNGHDSGVSGAAAGPGEPSTAAAGGAQGQDGAGASDGCQGQKGEAGEGALAEAGAAGVAGAAGGSHPVPLYVAKERAVLEEFLSIINKVGMTAAKKQSKQAAAAAAAGGPAAGAQQQQQQQQQQPEAALGSGADAGGGGAEGAAAAATLLPPLGLPGMQGQSLALGLQMAYSGAPALANTQSAASGAGPALAPSLPDSGRPASTPPVLTPGLLLPGSGSTLLAAPGLPHGQPPEQASLLAAQPHHQQLDPTFAAMPMAQAQGLQAGVSDGHGVDVGQQQLQGGGAATGEEQQVAVTGPAPSAPNGNADDAMMLLVSPTPGEQELQLAGTGGQGQGPGTDTQGQGGSGDMEVDAER